MTLGLVLLVERLVTVWQVGWAGRTVAAPIFLELAYAVFRQAFFVASLVQIVSGRKAGWNYVARPAVQAVGVGSVTTYGIVLPVSVLSTDWYQGPGGLGSASTRWCSSCSRCFLECGAGGELARRRTPRHTFRGSRGSERMTPVTMG